MEWTMAKNMGESLEFIQIVPFVIIIIIIHRFFVFPFMVYLDWDSSPSIVHSCPIALVPNYCIQHGRVDENNDCHTHPSPHTEYRSRANGDVTTIISQSPRVSVLLVTAHNWAYFLVFMILPK